MTTVADPMPAEQFDALVLGGGPAGSTAAALLCEAGHKVALIESQVHPRFHIGESLLPYTTPILARLGVLEAVRAIGVIKRGADFTADGVGRQEIDFRRALNPHPEAPNAFQVERAAFDALLFANAVRVGAAPFEGWTARRVELDSAGGPAVELRGPEGDVRWLRARQLMDATGRDGVLARKLGLRQVLAEHSSAALYAHYDGAEFQTGSIAGNISIYWFAHGWLWMIPLRHGLMSVGAVATVDYLKSRDVPFERFLDETIALCPSVAVRLRGAVRCGPVHVASNYSYEARQLYGAGWCLVGDAFAFVDPIFSSGVHFAMAGAEMLAAAVDARLRGAADAERRMARAERRLRRGLRHISWLIYRFNTPSLRRLFLNRRDFLGIERAVLSILAGDVFGRTRLRWRYKLFKLIYALDQWLARGRDDLPGQAGRAAGSSATGAA